MKNRIARLVKLRKIKFFEEDLPELKKGEVLVSIKAVGICGSDMHYFLEGGLGSFKQKLPMDIGHEPAGVIEKVFSSGEFKKGDRVAIEPGKACLKCEWCIRGKHNLCENGIFMVTNSQGAFADYVIVDETQLAKIPNNMSFEMGALMEPLGVAMHAVRLANPNSTHSVLIVGSGPIGLSIFSVLRKFGFREIYMVDKLDYRVNFAKKMGATRSFLFDKADIEIMKITKNKGIDFVFDAGGTQEALNLCIDLVKTAGTVSIVGIPTEDFISFNPHKARSKEIIIRNVRRSNQTLIDCIKLFSGDKETEKIISHKFNFNDIQKGFDLVSKYRENVIKCVITNK